MRYKVLIIEDESGIRRRLSKIIDWNNLCCDLCGQADSGISGLELIVKNTPDIVISDIVMPGIDGLTLFSYVKEKYNNVNFIFLTGYKEFEYAREALRLGANSLLSKPVDIEELKKAIMEIVLHLNETQYKIHDDTDKISKKLSLHDMVETLIHGKVLNDTLYKQLLNDLNIKNQYAILCIKLDDDSSILDYDEIFGALYETVSQRLNKVGIFCISISEYITIIVTDCIAEPFTQLSLTIYAGELHNRISISFKHSFSIGISDIGNDIKQTPEFFLQACYAAKEIFYSGQNSINSYNGEFVDSLSANNARLQEFGQNIVSFSLNEDNIINAFENTLEINKSIKLPSPHILKGYLISLIYQILPQTAAQNQKFAFAFLDSQDYLQTIIKARYITSVEVAFKDAYLVIKEFCLTRKSSDRELLVGKAIQFIEKNFASDITLKDVADAVYLSPPYLSSLIKLITKKNFIDILNQTRIENAIKLINEGNDKIHEVASKVGFRDPRYFSQVFKKFTNYSPSDKNQQDI